MPDRVLESLANKLHIPPWRRAGDQGEKWFVDRAYIIDQLVKRDNALREGQQPPTVNINVGEMHGSVIQQGNQNAAATVTFQKDDHRLRTFLKKLEVQAPQIPLSESARQKLNVDIGTINIHLSSPYPESSIIATSLRSIRAILESAVGSMIAPGLVFEMSKLLGQ